MIQWLLTHWYTLTGLGLAAFLFAVSIAGLCGLNDDNTERQAYKLGGGDSLPRRPSRVEWDNGNAAADNYYGDEAA